MNAGATDAAAMANLVLQADGSQIVQSLTQLGITEIRLTEDATKIILPDGSMISGQSAFVMNGVTRTVASAVLMAETQGYRVVEVVPLSGTDRVVVNTGYGADGKVTASKYGCEARTWRSCDLGRITVVGNETNPS